MQTIKSEEMPPGSMSYSTVAQGTLEKSVLSVYSTDFSPKADCSDTEKNSVPSLLLFLPSCIYNYILIAAS